MRLLPRLMQSTICWGLLLCLAASAQDKFPPEIDSAARLLRAQICGECEHHLAAQLKAIAAVDAYLAKTPKPALELLLLRAEASYVLAIVHYHQPKSWQAAQLQYARDLLRQLYQQHPNSVPVAEKYCYIMPDDDQQLLAAHQVVAKAKPQDADAHFDIGFLQMRRKMRVPPLELQRGLALQTWPRKLEDYFSKIENQVKTQHCQAEPQFAQLRVDFNAAMQGVDLDSDVLSPALATLNQRLIAQLNQLGCD